MTKIQGSLNVEDMVSRTFLDVEGAFNYTMVLFICDAARTHEINKPIIITIKSMVIA